MRPTRPAPRQRGAAAMLLTGPFALTHVPVYAGNLPVPCASSGVCGKQPFDPLNVKSTLSSGTSQLVYGPNGLVINQGSASSAIFNWASFNISAGYNVTFNQASASSVALNRIYDPNLTTISGNLRSNGQIYLINPNGILFGTTANVNVGGLIASTLDVSDQRITAGLLSDPLLAEPVFTSVAANATYSGVNWANAPLTASPNANPAITVQSGATLYAAGRDQSGNIVSAGRIFLFAPTVDVAGNITVDGGGQVIVAAGTSVYLGSSSDPSLRGLLVEVTGGGTNASPPAVSIDATGSISVARGNITLMGLAVNQAGKLTATSALDANGSIYLLARQAEPGTLSTDDSVLFAAAQTGTVNMASGSQTRVVLDPTDTATAPTGDPTADALRSTINIQGSVVTIGGQGKPGSTLIRANGGDITVDARSAVSANALAIYQVGDSGNVLGTSNPASTITVGSDALIDASGLQNVQVSGAQNFVYIDRLTSSNLANAPYQRTGFLLGQSLYVNLNEVPSWLDVSNLVAAQSSTQAQRNATAGTINLYAEGGVNLQKGSTLNVSGGSIDYTAAIGRTSNLITASGSIVNIANAPEDTQYIGFSDHGSTNYTDPQEGIATTSTWTVPNYTQVGGYSAGTAAGTIRIYAPQAQLNGTLLGTATSSAEQRNATGTLGGLLQIGSVNPSNSTNPSDLDSEAGFSRPSIYLTSNPASAPDSLSGASGAPIVLDIKSLLANGFTRFDLTSDGVVELANGSPLNLGPYGLFTVRAETTILNSAITAPGGTISIAQRPITALPGDTLTADELSIRQLLSLVTDASLFGSAKIAPGVALNVAGEWTNDAYPPAASAPTSPIVLGGGSIAVSDRLVDVTGASFDVSAGAYLSGTGGFSGGAAGSLSLTGTYKVPGANGTTIDTGELILGPDFSSQVRAFGVTAGGTLSLYAPSLTIAAAGDAGSPGANSSTTVVGTGVFQQGFQKINLSSFDAATLDPGVSISPVVELVPNSAALDATPSAPTLAATTTARPQAALPGQTFPASIALSASNTYAGTITLGAGSTIDAGTQGNITLNAGDRVDVAGELIAPAGTVTAALGDMPLTDLTLPIVNGRAIVLDPGALIDVNGVSLVTQAQTGLRSGNVLGGGTVVLDAHQGTLAVEAGSVIEAKGTRDAVDILINGAQYQRQTIASAGGTVDLDGSNGVLFEGSLQASGGSDSAGGGQLSLSLQTSEALATLQAQNVPAAVLQQLGGILDLTVSNSLPSLTAGQASFGPTANQGVITPATLNGSGLSRIWLQSPDTITLSGGSAGTPQVISAPASLVLASTSLQLGAGAQVELASPYVSVGPAEQLSSETVSSAFSNNAKPNATGGTGTLDISAGTLDLVGNLSLLNVGQANFNALADVRAIGVANPANPGPTVTGSFSFGGNLDINAARIYPVTQTAFAIDGPTADASVGSMTVGDAGAQAHNVPVLSAGGALAIDVGSLDVKGSILAPLGSLTLDATRTLTLEAGSVVSVAGDALVPYGTVLNGTNWTYGIPVGNTTIPISDFTIASPSGLSLAPKSITLSAGTLSAQSGSTISVAGGGEVQGVGFVAGPGGSNDYSQNLGTFVSTASTRNPFFALVPSQGSGVGAYDPQIYSNLVANSALPAQSAVAYRVGQTITIAPGSALPAGTYTILPARYALLPGAFAVEAASGYQNLQPGSAIDFPDGSAIVAGKIGDLAAGISASEWSGFRVYTSAQFQTFSQFSFYAGSSFFDTLAANLNLPAPQVAIDAGQLQIAANAILLNGAINARAASSGQAADIAIDVPNIVVADSVPASTTASPTLTLSAAELDQLGARSLVLGATTQRTLNATGTTITLQDPVASSSVTIESTQALTAGEILLSSATVQVDNGAALSNPASPVPTTTQIAASGDGALLYLGGSPTVPTFARTNVVSPSTGQLILGVATLTGGSLVVDATSSQSYAPGASIHVDSADLSASVINLGNAPAGTAGVDFTPAVLADFNGVQNLTLTTLSGLGIYGSAALGQVDASGHPLLQSLSLIGPGIAGFGAATDTLTIEAGQVNFSNNAGNSLALAGTGSGALKVTAQAGSSANGNINISGDISFNGFQAVNLSAVGNVVGTTTQAGTGDVVFSAAGASGTSFNVLGNNAALSISATRLTAQSGVTATINTPGSFSLAASGPAPASYDLYDLGASLTIAAGDIDVSGIIDLPAGAVSLQSTGSVGITLDSGSLIRVAGVTQDFASTSASAAAGTLSLVASNGSVSEASGATLDVSGSGSTGAAGILSISAPSGTVSLQGALVLTAGAQAQGATVSIDAGSMGDADALAKAIALGAQGDTLSAINLRARNGDVDINGGTTPTILSASTITLEADGNAGANDGSVNVAGVLNASASSGGQIAIYANDQINLSGTLDVHATSTAGSGGTVLLSAHVNDNAPAPGTPYDITLASGAQIDLRGGSTGADGTLILQAPFGSGGSSVPIAPIASGIVQANAAPNITVQGMTIVNANTSGLNVDGSGGLQLDAAFWSTEAAQLQGLATSANIASIATSVLGSSTADANFHVQPGLEIQWPGAVTVVDPVDFSTGLASAATGAGSFTWRYGGANLATSQPGVLVVRAGGDLSIQANISDGFLTTTDSNGNPLDTMWKLGNSWSYTLTGGADLSASNPNQTVAGAGSLYIGTTNEPGVVVRTGTGSITLNAGQNVVLDNGAGQQDNVVYTAGVNSVSHPAFPGFSGNDFYGNGLFLQPVLAQGGGNLSVNARNDILGTDVTGVNPDGSLQTDNSDGSLQTVNEWLYRYGAGTSTSPNVWWTDISSFQQGFGALGGGNLSLAAGADIIRVGAVVPGNGYAIGTAVNQFNSGTLTVTAGGAVIQGLYYDESGTTLIRAGSLQSNTSATQQVQNVRLAQGDNTLSIIVRDGAAFELPFNPTVVSASANLTAINDTNMFFTFGAKTDLDVQAATGDITALVPQGGITSPTGGAGGGIGLNGDAAGNNFVFTATNLHLTAFGGGITGSGWPNPVTQYPDPNGQLSLLANGSISQIAVTMSQADVATLPTAGAPQPANFLDLTIPLASTTPLHANDPDNAEVVTRNGSLSFVSFNIPKTTEISVGGDIGPLVQVDIQNDGANSLTSISAAGQINLTSGTPEDNISIGGQGTAQIVSGGAMNLGADGLGIVSTGNVQNTRLGAQGANLIVVAGAGSTTQNGGPVAVTPNYLNLIRTFIQYDAFAAAGSGSGGFNQQVIAALNANSSLSALVQVLEAGLKDRTSVNDPNSTFNQLLGQLSPAELAYGGVELSSAVQVVANAQFINSANTDTFAPAYAAFDDLFPNLANSAQVIRQFILNNPFAASAASAAALRNSVLQSLPTPLASLVQQGLANPAAVSDTHSAFSQQLAGIDPVTLQTDARALLAAVLAVAGNSRDTLAANGQLTGSGNPYATGLTALAAAFAPTTPAGLNDLQMQFNQIKAEQTGAVAVLAPQGSVLVGQDSPPVLDAFAKNKTASELGIFTLSGGDIIGMVRDDFNVFQSRVFTVDGGNISLWSSLANIDAGRGPRDVAVVAPPVLETDPNTGVEFLDFGAAVTGSGIGALQTSLSQAPSNINLMAPAGYVDAGEAGIRAQTGKVFLGTNLVLNASNIQAASGVSGGAVVAAPPPPPPPSTGTSSGDKIAEEASREALAQQISEQRNATLHVTVSGEFLGFERDCPEDSSKPCNSDKDQE